MFCEKGKEMAFFEVGKLPPDVLGTLLQKIDLKDPRVVVGPRVGVDAAVFDMGDRYLVVKTDPVTFTEKRIAWYCVNVNANDVAAMGAEPRWFLVTLLLPEEKSDREFVEALLDDILKSCSELGISLCGGHTEITAGLDRSILIGQMLGEVPKEKLVTPDKIVAGDAVLLTKGIAIEGTAILAKEMEDILSDRMPSDVLLRAEKFLENPGISVVKAAMTASRAANVHGMHDPTEGGIATGLWELGQASRCGLRIEADSVPVYPETQAFSELLGMDPWGLIASGALLIVVDPKDVDKVVSALSDVNIRCTPIGRIVPPEDGMVCVREGNVFPLEPFVKDELVRVLDRKSFNLK